MPCLSSGLAKNNNMSMFVILSRLFAIRKDCVFFLNGGGGGGGRTNLTPKQSNMSFSQFFKGTTLASNNFSKTSTAILTKK